MNQYHFYFEKTNLYHLLYLIFLKTLTLLIHVIFWSLTWKICRYIALLPDISTTNGRDKLTLASNHKFIQQDRFMFPIFIFQQQHCSVKLVISTLTYIFFQSCQTEQNKYCLLVYWRVNDLTWENLIYTNWHFLKYLTL